MYDEDHYDRGLQDSLVFSCCTPLKRRLGLNINKIHGFSVPALTFVVAFVFNPPPTAKVIWRRGHGLKSHLTDWWSRESNLRPLVYKASGLSTTLQRLLLTFVLSSYSRTVVMHVLIALNVLSVFLEKVRLLINSLLFCFVWYDSLRPINNLSDKQGRVFLGWTSTKLG